MALLRSHSWTSTVCEVRTVPGASSRSVMPLKDFAAQPGRYSGDIGEM